MSKNTFRVSPRDNHGVDQWEAMATYRGISACRQQYERGAKHHFLSRLERRLMKSPQLGNVHDAKKI